MQLWCGLWHFKHTLDQIGEAGERVEKITTWDWEFKLLWNVCACVCISVIDWVRERVQCQIN